MTGKYNRTIFFDHVRQNPFGGSLTQSQVDGMNALLAYIERLGWEPTQAESQYFNYWNAYDFATTFHETAFTMQPVTEYGSQAYLQSKSYWPYIGRGFVQMTWEDNYKRSDKEIAEGDLVSEETLAALPDKKVNQHKYVDQALNLEIAACNLMIGCWKGWWTGKKLGNYLTNTKKDYVNARRIVNGTDKAEQIARYAEDFERAFMAAWQDEPAEVDPPETPPPMPPPGEGEIVTVRMTEKSARALVAQIQAQLTDEE